MSKMTPHLVTNLCDAAMADASDRLKYILNMLGQDVDRGYRRALAPLFGKHPSDWSSPYPNLAEEAVSVLNFVVFMADKWPGTPKVQLTDDKLADLCSFFIGRFLHSEAAREDKHDRH